MIKWKNDKLKTLVFNKNFRENNFRGKIAGIFTLGAATISYELLWNELKNDDVTSVITIQNILFCELIKDGYKLKYEHVLTNDKIIERKSISKELIRQGYATNANEAFSNILIYNEKQINFLLALANKHNLEKSIGTDYHGIDIREALSFEKEGVQVDESIIEFIDKDYKFKL